MNIVKRKKLIEVEYYDCGKIDHQHNTLKGAENCVKKSKIPPKKDLTYRNVEIALRLLGGDKPSKIANDYGIKKERVAQVVTKALRKAANMDSHLKTNEKAELLSTIHVRKQYMAHKDYWLSALGAYEKNQREKGSAIN